jgi:capsular polysaccharide biosynthesis protein
MELRRYLFILRRHIPLIVVVVIAAVALGFVTTTRTKIYAASAVVFVEPSAIGRNPQTGAVNSDPLVAAGIVSVTFARLIQSEPTADIAVKQTGAPRTAQQVKSETAATPVTNTSLIVVTIKDKDAALAESLANGVANAFVTEIKTLEPAGPYYDPQPATVFEPALAPGGAVKTKVTRQMLVYGGFGLFAAIALSVLLDYLDITVRGAKDAESRLRLPVLGTVPVGRAHA